MSVVLTTTVGRLASAGRNNMDEPHFTGESRLTVRETVIGFFCCMFAIWLMGVIVEHFN